MRLLIAADIFPPQSGGPATYCVTLANELTKQGIEVSIVSLNANSDASVVSCYVYRVSWKNKLLRYAQYFFLLLKHAKEVNVIYAMGPINAGLPAWLAASLRGKKFVVKVVGDYAWEQGQVRGLISDSIDDFQKHASKYPLRVQLLKLVESFVVKHADQIIVPSKYLAGIVKGWGAKEEKIKLVYNETDFILGTPIEHPAEKWVVSVGRLTPWKGMNTLIEIIPDLIKQIPNLKLKIVGDGPEMNNLRKKVTGNHLEDIIELAGNLSKEKTLAYIASADVFILNSSYEGHSHVLVEAHNQGVPVLASSVGGNMEVSAGPSLFEYNNKEEIKQKIIKFSSVGKGKSIPHSFAGGPAVMIEKTKEILQNLCNPQKSA